MASAMGFCYSEDSLDILLMGRTGDGKSETGNTILGRKSFATSACLKSVTEIGQFDYCEFEGNVIKVVDTPGLGDTKSDRHGDVSLLVHEITIAIANSPRGYNALLYVVKYGNRYTDENVKIVKILKAILGDNIIKNHCIIVMTYGDLFEPDEENKKISFDEWVMQQQNDNFQKLVKKCGQRIILFDNRTKDRNKQREQKRKLIKMIMGSNSNMKRYTNDHFEKARAKRDELIKKLYNEKEYEDGINILGILNSRLQFAIEDDSDADKVKEIESEIDELLEETKLASTRNKLLQNTINLLNVFKEVVEAKTTGNESEARKKFTVLMEKYALAKDYKHKNVVTLIIGFLKKIFSR